MHRWRILSRRAGQLACLAFGLVISATTGAQEPLMQDDFDGGVIDAELWQVTLPYSNPPRRTVKEDGGSLELFRRGIIDSAGSLPHQIDIEGRFRFTGEGDTLSIVLRSDLTVTNLFERRGVQLALQQATDRVFLIPELFVSVPIRGSFVIGKDTDIAFRMIDDG